MSPIFVEDANVGPTAPPAPRARRAARPAAPVARPAVPPAPPRAVARGNRWPVGLLGLLGLCGLCGLLGFWVFVAPVAPLAAVAPLATPAAPAVTSAEALPTAAEAIVAPEPVACPEGTSQIPGWSNWTCGDSAFIGATDADYPGYVFGPVTGILYIDPNHLDAHGYRDENGDGIGATLWPAESPSDGHDLPTCASQVDVALGAMNQIVVDQGCVLAIGGDIEN